MKGCVRAGPCLKVKGTRSKVGVQVAGFCLQTLTEDPLLAYKCGFMKIVVWLFKTVPRPGQD